MEAPDDHRYVTDRSRRLLATLGVELADELSVEAVMWLADSKHETAATRRVRPQVAHLLPYAHATIQFRGVR